MPKKRKRVRLFSTLNGSTRSVEGREGKVAQRGGKEEKRGGGARKGKRKAALGGETGGGEEDNAEL